MTTSLYPDIVEGRDADESIEKIQDWIEQINFIRETEDIGDFNNLNQRFLPGRKEGRIPTSATDVVASDQVGDVSNDATFIYELIEETAGVFKWNRQTLDISW